MEESESYIVRCSDFTTRQCCLQGKGASSVSRGSAGFLEPYTKTESQAGCSCYLHQWWKWFYWRKGFPSITNVLFLVVIVQSLSCVWLFVTPLIAPHQASLSSTISWSLFKLCPLSRWCHPTYSFSVTPFFSYPQSFPVTGSFPITGSFPMSWLFASGGQSNRRPQSF